MKTPATQLSLKLARKEGYIAEVVEHFIKTKGGGFKRDLFGFIDILAVHPEHGTLAIQTTSKSNMSSRRKKINESDIYPILKFIGWTIELHGWWHDGKGKKYQLKREVL